MKLLQKYLFVGSVIFLGLSGAVLATQAPEPSRVSMRDEDDKENLAVFEEQNGAEFNVETLQKMIKELDVLDRALIAAYFYYDFKLVHAINKTQNLQSKMFDELMDGRESDTAAWRTEVLNKAIEANETTKVLLYAIKHQDVDQQAGWPKASRDLEGRLHYLFILFKPDQTVVIPFGVDEGKKFPLLNK